MGNKGWSILFGIVMAACAIGYGISPFMGWSMPEGASSHADDVDFLYYVILWITTFFFFLTEGILVLFMWRYSSVEGGKRPVGDKAELPGYMKPLANILHDQHRVEMAWTLVPALILIYIAFAQVNTWANIKYESRRQHLDESQPASLQIAVSARQFEWRMRYPNVAQLKNWLKDKKASQADMDSFGRVPQSDDIYVVNELHFWQDHQVLVYLTTRDVIHSLNLPNFRVKQDALPGKLIPVWFKTRESKAKNSQHGVDTYNCHYDAEKKRYVDGINPTTDKEDKNFIYDIPCAELCGWGHYRMIGRVFVHKDEAQFLDWLQKAEENSHLRTSDR